MALTPAERRRMHRQLDSLIGQHVHNYTKPQLDEAFDKFEADRIANEAALKTAVDEATTGRNWTQARFERLQRAYWIIRAKDGF